MPDRLGDLVERLLDVARDGEDVAKVSDGDRFPQVDAELETVRPIQRGDLADALGTETGSRPVGGAPVEGDTEHCHVVLAAAVDVLDVRCLEEGGDTSEVRQLTTGEGGDPPVDDRVGAGQAQLKTPGDLLFPLRRWQRRFRLDGESRLRAVVVMQVVHVVAFRVHGARPRGSRTWLVSRAFVPP